MTSYNKILGLCGHWYDPQYIDCPHCPIVPPPPPGVSVIHFFIGAGVGWITWHKTQNSLLALGAGLVAAWFFQTKLGRLIALLSILGLAIYLASNFYVR
jgi:hypothetical protein